MYKLYKILLNRRIESNVKLYRLKMKRKHYKSWDPIHNLVNTCTLSALLFSLKSNRVGEKFQFFFPLNNFIFLNHFDFYYFQLTVFLRRVKAQVCFTLSRIRNICREHITHVLVFFVSIWIHLLWQLFVSSFDLSKAYFLLSSYPTRTKS